MTLLGGAVFPVAGRMTIIATKCDECLGHQGTSHASCHTGLRWVRRHSLTVRISYRGAITPYVFRGVFAVGPPDVSAESGRACD